jgi:hypothetical protein
MVGRYHAKNTKYSETIDRNFINIETLHHACPGLFFDEILQERTWFEIQSRVRYVTLYSVNKSKSYWQ